MNRIDMPVVLLTGATGQLGRWILREFALRGHRNLVGWSGRTSGQFEGFDVEPVSLENKSEVERKLEAIRPDVVIHTAAMSAADEVRKAPELGRLINEEGTRTLAEWCGRAGSRIIYTSTDLVFDGTKSMWTEDDAPAPLLEYGRTKARSEPLVTSTAHGLVARIALLYGPTLTGRPSFYSACIDALRHGGSRDVFMDEYRTPLDYASAAQWLCDLTLEHPGKSGVIHMGGPERMSRYDLIRRSAVALGLDASLVRPSQAAETQMPEPRPRDVSLSTAKLDLWLPGRTRRTPEDVANLLTTA